MTENTEVATPVAAVEPAVETETQNPVDVKPEGTAPEGEDAKQVEPVKTFTQEEVDALVKKRLMKEERAITRRFERQQAEAAQRALIEQEPKREDFRDDDAYLDAKVEQLAEKKAAEKLQRMEARTNQEKASEAFLERAEKVLDKYPDFHEVMGNPSLKFNDAMVEFVADSDYGPDVAYHLGKRPSEAARIAEMSPIKAARELARIEAEVSAKPTVKTSSAPAPITPVGTRGSAQQSLANMDFAEYKKTRMAQNPSWRR
jgi:hypothetical protein